MATVQELSLDPLSLVVSQNFRSHDQAMIPLSLKPDAYLVLERGPRYRAYADMREAKLRRKHMRQPEPEIESYYLETPPSKQMKFHGRIRGSSGYSITAQSVPDWHSAIQKENRKPMNALPPLHEQQTPLSSRKPMNAAAAAARPLKGGRLALRKSYAFVEDLKRSSSASAATIPIAGGDRNGGRSLRGGTSSRQTILGSRLA